jgi:transposase InsO family protein
VTYRFIDLHKDHGPVRLLCETLEVSPAGSYAWRQRPRSAQEQGHDTLLVEIRALHAFVKARYGSPRIHKGLVARGHACCVNTVAKRMRDNDIQAKTARKFRVRTTDAHHDLPVADNLLDRPFNPSEANEAPVAAITYIPTREGWLDLAAVFDLYSRRVVGWAMAEHREGRLVVDALERAVQRRLPGEGLLSHSDRGSPYAGPARDPVQQEPQGGRLGQCAEGEFFRVPEKGAGSRRRLRPAGGGASGDFRVHRGVLQ